ncbi:hypothetical protein BDZ89DRAFT_1067431 [Hymenopellis radicata]|nr:hypothetical protein BDZ89DRAFT_1067431 [Hymenopellis radicata]
MSKALGAAFLNHQVEQLEKSVGGNDGGNWRGRGGGPPKPNAPRRTMEPKKEKPQEKQEKEADIIVADASVLVHGLEHIRKWCQRGRDEIVIVPLEALNTLDLLKKSSKSAREASRILEKQVGANPRIRVQQDDAFVLWDKIHFTDAEDASPSPEWVRRTICSARWEVEQGAKPKIVLAVSSVTGPAERANGALVALWAKRAGVEVLELPPTPWTGGHGRKSSDEDRREPRKDVHPQQKAPPVRRREREERQPLVERVPAPTKVIRVLARGEKLD